MAVPIKPDFLFRLAWPLLLLGAFTTPMLVLRVGWVTLADLAFLAGSLLTLASSARVRPKPHGVVQLAVALCALAALSASINAVNPDESLLVGLRLLYVWTIWQFGVRACASEPRQILQLASAFVLGSAASGLTAVAQATLGLAIPGAEIVFGRVPGLANHVNGQGGALAVGASIAIGLVIINAGRVIHLMSLTLIVAGLVLAGSVTGMMGAVAGTLLALILGRVPLLRTVVASGAVALVFSLVDAVQRAIPGAASPLERFAETTGQGSGESTLRLRLLTDEYALEAILKNPIVGVGLDAASGATYNGLTQTHNLFLLAWFQGGIALFIAVVLVVAQAVRSALRTKIVRLDARIPVLAGCLGAFVFAMTGPVLFDRWFWLPFILALATTQAAGVTAEGLKVGGKATPTTLPK